MSRNSLLKVDVIKSLDVVKFEHHTQTGTCDEFRIYRSQIPKLIKYLEEAKAWIESNYDDKEKPEDIDEYGGKGEKWIPTFSYDNH